MDNGGFIYVIIIVALVLKGVIDFIWKRSAKMDEVLPPFDPRQQPQSATPRGKKKKKNSTADNIPVSTVNEPAVQPVVEISAPSIQEIQTPSIKEEADNPVIQNVEELKKAVIYSEILNRKYN